MFIYIYDYAYINVYLVTYMSLLVLCACAYVFVYHNAYMCTYAHCVCTHVCRYKYIYISKHQHISIRIHMYILYTHANEYAYVHI